MLLGGFKVVFESVWVGLELICARCALAFGLQGVVAQPKTCANQLRANPNRLKDNLKPSQQHSGYQPFTKPE